MISMYLEVQNSLRLYGKETRDGYEFVYIWLRFPIWWLIGFGELIIIQTNLHFKLKKVIPN